MHSSRMRTGRLLPVSPSMHCSLGVYLVPGGVPAPEGGGYLPRYPPGQNSSRTLLKILPCHKLRLRAVTRKHSSRMRTARFSSSGGRGGLCPTPFWMQTPGCLPNPPLPDADLGVICPTPSPDADAPGCTGLLLRI